MLRFHFNVSSEIRVREKNQNGNAKQYIQPTFRLFMFVWIPGNQSISPKPKNILLLFTYNISQLYNGINDDRSYTNTCYTTQNTRRKSPPAKRERCTKKIMQFVRRTGTRRRTGRKIKRLPRVVEYKLACTADFALLKSVRKRRIPKIMYNEDSVYGKSKAKKFQIRGTREQKYAVKLKTIN